MAVASAGLVRGPAGLPALGQGGEAVAVTIVWLATWWLLMMWTDDRYGYEVINKHKEKSMRKLFVTLVALFSMAVMVLPSPVEAAPDVPDVVAVAAAPTTASGHFIEVEFGGCDVIAAFFTYGNAVAYMNEFSTSNCGAQSWIQVWGATSAGVGAGPWCKMAYRLGNPYPGLCSYDGLAVTAVVGGTALGFHIRLCAANGVCDYERNYNLWDGLP